MTPRDRNLKRAAAAQACVDRFAGRDYAEGRRDCVHMAAHCLHRLGIATPQLKGVKYSSPTGAIRALKRAGFASLIEAVDAMGFARIAPAAAWPADLIALETDHPVGALAVRLSGGDLLAFAANEDAAQVFPSGALRMITAWRVI